MRVNRRCQEEMRAGAGQGTEERGGDDRSWCGRKREGRYRKTFNEERHGGRRGGVGSKRASLCVKYTQETVTRQLGVYEMSITTVMRKPRITIKR